MIAIGSSCTLAIRKSSIVVQYTRLYGISTDTIDTGGGTRILTRARRASRSRTRRAREGAGARTGHFRADPGASCRARGGARARVSDQRGDEDERGGGDTRRTELGRERASGEGASADDGGEGDQERARGDGE